jgi:hypothetical protein
MDKQATAENAPVKGGAATAHRFRDYSADELRACGQAFVAAFSGSRCEKTGECTLAVKRFFAETAVLSAGPSQARR